MYENTTEDKDLKKALLASLKDVKKNEHKSTLCQKKNKTENQKTNKSQENERSQSDVCKNGDPLVDDSNCSLLSLAAQRRGKVSAIAQRKFAQTSGHVIYNPVWTPIKTGSVATNNMVDLLPNQKPNTEDFLTFLCLRRSPILPPKLDFIRMESDYKVNGEKTSQVNCHNLSDDHLEANDKYTTCRLRASTDRRASASSTVSKAASMSSRTSLQSSVRKKCETQRKETKTPNGSTKKNQSTGNDNDLKKVEPELAQNVKHIGKNVKSETNSVKLIDSLKQKYKQQRIHKNSGIPSKSLNSPKKTGNNDIGRTKDSNTSPGIQTRQKIKNESQKAKDDQINAKSSDHKSDSSERVLRSHQSYVQTVSESVTKSSNNRFNSKRNKSNSSQIGIRPKKRKAKPVVPLIDYYFDSEFESDSDKKEKINSMISKQDNKAKDSKQIRTINAKKSLNEIKTRTSKPSSHSREQPKPQNQLVKKETIKSKTTVSSGSTRRMTRSSRPMSNSKPVVIDSELERQIKEKIIAIERKHKRLRRCPSNQSLLSSSSSSSSSSESLPESVSSSSSIDNTRLTRSLGHLKKIRDYQAKLKKQQNKKELTNKSEVKTNPTKIKQKVVNKRLSSPTKKSELSTKQLKTSSLKTPVKKSQERAVTRRMRDSVVSAMSDTDCDTEGIFK